MVTKPLSEYDVHETPGVSGGYPCVGTTRIPVRVIVEFMHAGASVERILAMYPHLTVDQVHGALAYYEAYPDRVDEDIRTNAEAFAALKRR
jgi:uncharacterized protein (DUF433 family)